VIQHFFLAGQLIETDEILENITEKNPRFSSCRISLLMKSPWPVSPLQGQGHAGNKFKRQKKLELELLCGKLM